MNIHTKSRIMAINFEILLTPQHAHSHHLSFSMKQFRSMKMYTTSSCIDANEHQINYKWNTIYWHDSKQIFGWRNFWILSQIDFIGNSNYSCIKWSPIFYEHQRKRNFYGKTFHIYLQFELVATSVYSKDLYWKTEKKIRKEFNELRDSFLHLSCKMSQLNTIETNR